MVELLNSDKSIKYFNESLDLVYMIKKYLNDNNIDESNLKYTYKCIAEQSAFVMDSKQNREPSGGGIVFSMTLSTRAFTTRTSVYLLSDLDICWMKKNVDDIIPFIHYRKSMLSIAEYLAKIIIDWEKEY